MGKPTGFIEFDRKPAPYREAAVRLLDFDEIYTEHDPAKLAQQGARCMDCGVPFCQSEDGCPIHNLIPEWNDLVYRDQWKDALDRLHKTNNFPEFTKLEKTAIVERRVNLLREEGIEFHTNSDIGDGTNGTIDIRELQSSCDAVLMTTGATVPRNLDIPGRELDGVHFAMDFLTQNTKSLLDSNHADGAYISAKDKHVIVIGGGDTGTDCIGTSLRHGCKSLVNFELFPQPPEQRADDNPWPTWPKIYRSDYGHEESDHTFGGDPRVYRISSTRFIGENGKLTGVQTEEVEFKNGKFEPVPGSEREWKADLVLLAMGFLGPEHGCSDPLNLQYDARSNYQAQYGQYKTSTEGVYAAGDCRRGQSLVVWAINEGREAAREIDRELSGSTLLP